jgi:hypothetical protein
MSHRRFRWTRKKYKHANWLARFMGRHLYELHHQPDLLRRYFELWDRYPGGDDPLLIPLARRHDRDSDIPF